jgi:hypothetical protein
MGSMANVVLALLLILLAYPVYVLLGSAGVVTPDDSPTIVTVFFGETVRFF